MKVKYEIIKKLGTLEGKEDRFHVEANIIAWDDGLPKLDLRKWNGENPGKGFCLSEEGLKRLREILQDVTL